MKGAPRVALALAVLLAGGLAGCKRHNTMMLERDGIKVTEITEHYGGDEWKITYAIRNTGPMQRQVQVRVWLDFADEKYTELELKLGREEILTLQSDETRVMEVPLASNPHAPKFTWAEQVSIRRTPMVALLATRVYY